MPVDDGRCFACGPDNPAGLHLQFERAGERSVRARTTLADTFQGWQDIAHGGVGMMLLDEAMAHAAAAAGFRGMTASLSLRFRAPVPLREALDLYGEVVWIRRNVLAVRATVKRGGELLLEGDGHFVAKGRLEDVADRRS